MVNLINKIKNYYYPIKTKTLKEIYNHYNKLDINEKDSFKKLIDFLNKDDLLKIFAGVSKVDCLYHYLGDSIKYDEQIEEFYILDASSAGFPDYIPAERYLLTKENYDKLSFLPKNAKHLKDCILNYIKKIDKVITQEKNYLDYKPKLKKSPFELLVEEAKKTQIIN